MPSKWKRLCARRKRGSMKVAHLQLDLDKYDKWREEEMRGGREGERERE